MKFILGILVGFFVVPVVLLDPVGAVEGVANIAGKFGELAGFIGGLGN